MNISKSASQALTNLISRGVEKSADKLGTMSKAKWAMEVVSVMVGTSKRLRDSFDKDPERYYGSYFLIPDGVLLMLVSESSSHKIAKAYIGDDAKKLGSVPNLNEYILGEISNVVVNTLAAELADTCGMGFLTSAPEMAQGSKKHLYAEMENKFPGIDYNLAVTSYIHMSSAALSADCSVYILLNERLTANLLAALDG